MENLKKLIIADVKKSKRNAVIEANKITNRDVTNLSWYMKQFTTNDKQRQNNFKNAAQLRGYILNRINTNFDKKLIEELKTIDFSNVGEIPKEFTITVDWKKNRTWGSNPTAEAFVYGLGWLSSGSIGGCGYDKRSTAVSYVLNQIPALKLLMCQEKNKRHNFKKRNEKVFGYGSGYRIVPSFEGGVGVSCYTDILKTIGYKFETIANTKNTDVYRVTKL